MKVALGTLTAACALLAAASGANGSAGVLHVGPLGMVPHTTPTATHAIPTFSVHTSATCGVSCTSYESSIDQYFTNVAAASGTNTNVYSVATQYSDTTGPIAYSSTFGGAYVDTSSFVSSGCNDGADPVCLTDDQLQAEISKVIAAEGWPTGGTSLFFIMLPSSVGVCIDGSSGECSTNTFCAYHSAFGTYSDPTIYAVEPYNASINGCSAGESPNGDDADATINTISHEQSEAISDPLLNAWYSADANGDEMADLCAWTFGAASGSLGAEYNQVINGHDYFLQQEYSNDDSGCVQHLGGIALPSGPNDGSGPLVYNGGPVMRTNTTYAIYWMPNGSPGSTAAPTISGTAAVNHALTSTAGSWNSAPTGYAYQWQRCSASGTSCANIAGATGSTYTVQVADAGGTVRSTVSAENALGASSYVASAVSGLITPLPATTAAPVVTGRAGVGKTLSTTPGTWNTPMTFAYQWLRCDAAGAACTSIAGATDSTYVVKNADGGHTLQARVSATNESGTTAALSNVTGVVAATPAAMHTPRISGKAKVGHTLKAATGTWNGSPTAFAYQWLRCNASGGHCVKVGHATRPTYKATKRDAGHRLRVRVTARNSAGGVAATSAPSAEIHR